MTKHWNCLIQFIAAVKLELVFPTIYIIAANLSDIAAMGCNPTGLTNIFRYHSSITNSQFEEVIIGMKKACIDNNCIIVGGDIGSYQDNVLVFHH